MGRYGLRCPAGLTPRVLVEELRMQGDERQPVFNVPGIVAGVLGVLVLVHGVRQLLSDRVDDGVLGLFAFNPARYDVAGFPGEPWAGPLSFLSHALLHGDWLHLAINGAWLLAVGSPIARRTSAGGFLGLFALCGAGGALLFLALHPGLDGSLVGASGAISGLMGAVFRLLFAARTAADRELLSSTPADAPRLSLAETFTSRSALTAIGVWVVVNMLAAFGLGGLAAPGAIAWEAHLGGFLTGLLSFDLFDRGRGPRSNAGRH
jgi:membrane associated rhomboid family serine protease